MLSQKIIIITPITIPIITTNILDNSIASGINSKHTIETIKPAANSKIKLRNLFELFFNDTPIIPPNVVPNVPKIKPKMVVLRIISKIIISFFY